VKIDFTELNEQRDIAAGLSQGKYTAESWQVFADALAKANSLRNSKDQAAVDAAAKALKEAIAGLVEMDYSKLIAAMDQVANLTANDELAELFRQLFEANAEGKQLLSSGDQAAVDAGAAKITDLLAKIAAKLEELKKSDIVEVDKEVEVEVMPSDDYCNIQIHKVWPILFWISFVLNLCFIGLIVFYFVRKKQNQKDNTPLVDYDISDDEE
jgi:cbb3-type cytochrome oxidase subunit 3